MCSPPPVIARRSCGGRRSEASEDGDDNLEGERIGERVREMRREEKMREGEKREAGVVGGRLEIQNSPVAMADGSSSCAAAWRRLARVFGARLKRRRWGLSRGDAGRRITPIRWRFLRDSVRSFVFDTDSRGRRRRRGARGEGRSGKMLGRSWACSCGLARLAALFYIFF